MNRWFGVAFVTVREQNRVRHAVRFLLWTAGIQSRPAPLAGIGLLL